MILFKFVILQPSVAMAPVRFIASLLEFSELSCFAW